MVLDKVFQAVSRVLKPLGVFAFNLWWHSFSEISQGREDLDWRPSLTPVLKEYNEDPPDWSASKSKNLYSRENLIQFAIQAGLKLEKVIVDQDEVSQTFFIDFMSMYPDWPKTGLGDKRTQIIERAREVFNEKTLIPTVRFLWRKI